MSTCNYFWTLSKLFLSVDSPIWRPELTSISPGAGTAAILHSFTLAQLTKRMSLARKNEEAAANLWESEEAAASLQEAKEFKESKEWKE